MQTGWYGSGKPEREGAQTTEKVAKIIKANIPGLLEARSEAQLDKTAARRKARKERNKGKEKVASEAKTKKRAKKAKGAGKAKATKEAAA